MKKIIIFLSIVVIIVAGISYLYLNYKANYEISKKENMEYESYYNKEILGTEVATLINRTVDVNTKNTIQKNNKGIFIENEENSIKMEIKFSDDENIHPAEIIFSNGIEKFVQYYGEIKFKCTKIEYHTATNKIKYILLEQITG